MDCGKFYGDQFGLKFLVIDGIVDAILAMEGRVTVAKKDIACAFHNLHATPADALKIGIN